MADWSEDRTTYFAKNSDRSPNEPHLIIHIPGIRHAPGSKLRCSYISIPPVEYTRELILFKPSWIWGAEMGVNESRVAIGNEAVFTKSKKGEPALTGMDMLRLALERSGSAASAIEILIELLETYGQGGNCGYDHPFFYDNSFLAADPKEAFVMETSGRNYAVIRVENSYAISNRLTIGKNHSRRGASVGEEENFARRRTEPVYSWFSAANVRRQLVCDKLKNSAGAAGLIEILRSHNPALKGREFSRGSVNSVCMHAGGIIGDHTTGSMAAVLREEKPITLWCTGASTPCISAFKPVFWGHPSAPVFEDPAQSMAYWLKREQLHRAVIAGKADAVSLAGRIRALENEWLLAEQQIMNGDKPDAGMLIALSARADEQEQNLMDEFYTEQWQNINGKGLYGRYWNRKNKELKPGQGAPMLKAKKGRCRKEENGSGGVKHGGGLERNLSDRC